MWSTAVVTQLHLCVCMCVDAFQHTVAVKSCYLSYSSRLSAQTSHSPLISLTKTFPPEEHCFSLDVFCVKIAEDQRLLKYSNQLIWY